LEAGDEQDQGDFETDLGDIPRGILIDRVHYGKESNRDKGKEVDSKIQDSGSKMNLRTSSVFTRYIDGSNEGDNGMEDDDCNEEEFACLKKASPHRLLER